MQAITEAMDEYRAESASGHVAGQDFDEMMAELDTVIRAKLPRQ